MLNLRFLIPPKKIPPRHRKMESPQSRQPLHIFSQPIYISFHVHSLISMLCSIFKTDHVKKYSMEIKNSSQKMFCESIARHMT